MGLRTKLSHNAIRGRDVRFVVSAHFCLWGSLGGVLFLFFETRVMSLAADGNKLDLRIPRNRVECWDDILFQMEVWIEVGKACG